MNQAPTSKPGRNVACPCGSGKKHKNCCGRADRRGLDDPLPFVTPPGMSDRDAALTKLWHYSGTARFDRDRRLAGVLFFGDGLEDLPPEQMTQVLGNDSVQLNFQNFLAIDLDCDDGRTILDQFLTEHGDTLSFGERDYLESLTRTCVRPYQVREVIRDEGLRVVDLWTDEEQWLSERRATHELVRWDVFAARVMELPDGRHVIEGDLYGFPCAAKERILESLRRAYKTFTCDVPDAQPFTFFKRCAAVALGPIWLDETLARPTPKLVTPEGDEVEFGERVFGVQDPVSLARALDETPHLEAQGDGRWHWTEPTDDLERSLGVFILEGHELTIETLSRRRMKQGKALLKAAVGNAVHHQATKYEKPDLSSGSSTADAGPQDIPPEAPPEATAEVTPEATPETIGPEDANRLAQQMLDRHYRRWVDEPVPALDHRTPREAAALKTQRPRVIDLLRQMENNEAHRALDTQQPPHDFAWLWRELGLDDDG